MESRCLVEVVPAAAQMRLFHVAGMMIASRHDTLLAKDLREFAYVIPKEPSSQVAS